MVRLAVGLMALALSTSFSVAQDATPDVIKGLGTKDCSFWVSARKSGQVGEYSAASWLLGFLSSAALARPDAPFVKAAPLELVAYADRYCAANTEVPIWTAARDIALYYNAVPDGWKR